MGPWGSGPAQAAQAVFASPGNAAGSGGNSIIRSIFAGGSAMALAASAVWVMYPPEKTQAPFSETGAPVILSRSSNGPTRIGYRRRRRCAPRRVELLAMRPSTPLRGPILADTALLSSSSLALKPPDLQLYAVGGNSQALQAQLRNSDLPVCFVTDINAADAVVDIPSPPISPPGPPGPPPPSPPPPSPPPPAPPPPTPPPGGDLPRIDGGGGTAPSDAVSNSISNTSTAPIAGSTNPALFVNDTPTSTYDGTGEPGAGSFIDQDNPFERPEDAAAAARARAAMASATKIRVSPQFAIMGRGRQQDFKVEALGSDGKWRVVTGSRGTDFRLTGAQTQGIVQHRARKNAVVVPFTAPLSWDGTRAWIDVTFRTPGGRQLKTRALAIASLAP